MNNDITQHDTTHNTTRHYYMGTYSLGHHLWVAGESYMDTAQALIGAGSTDFARTFIGQAEEAFTWANALQAGKVLESLDDLLGVEIDTLDAWVAPERMSDLKIALAMAELVARGETLPVSPSDAATSGQALRMFHVKHCPMRRLHPPLWRPAPAPTMETWKQPLQQQPSAT